MKIDLDCMKNVMIYLEENLSIDGNGNFLCVEPLEIAKSSLIMGRFSKADVLYALLQLHEHKYIVSDIELDTKNRRMLFRCVLYITPKGYDFLSGAKESAVWNSVKSVMSSAKSFSFRLLESALWEAVQNQFALPPS